VRADLAVERGGALQVSSHLAWALGPDRLPRGGEQGAGLLGAGAHPRVQLRRAGGLTGDQRPSRRQPWGRRNPAPVEHRGRVPEPGQRGAEVRADLGILHNWYGTASGDLVHSGTMGGGWNNYSDLTGMGDIGDETGTGGGNFKTAQLAIGFFSMSYDPQ